MAIVDTYEGFILLYDIPYTVVVILYLIAKYIAIIAVLVQRCKSCDCWTKFAKPWRKYTSWMTRIVFGGTEGVSDNNSSLYADEHGIKKVYIRGIPVQKENLDILGAIITCFSLLLLLTMYSTYLLEITFQCSEDPAIYCFARPADDDDASNLIIDQNQRITNCSDYNNLTFSSPISINCFRYALNAKEALAIGGGLLAIFTVTLRFLISTISNIWIKMDKYNHLRKALRITAIIVLTIFNLVATIVLVAFAYAGRTDSLESKGAPVAQQTAAYLADNGVQFVIMLSTVELLLLLDWNEFKTNKNEDKKGKNEGKEMKEIS